MKVYITSDAWEPVYELTTNARASESMEITDKEWADYQRVMSEFDAWQKKIKALPS